MKTPAVSVIMPCHNGSRTLHEAVQSVIGQSFSDWELVVVNDGSTDASADILAQYAASDARIRVFTNLQASGASGARNRALAEARGRYIAFLDTDDAWRPGKLETEVVAMERFGAALVCSAYDVIDATGRITGDVRPPAGPLTYRSMLANNAVGTLTAMLDTKLCGQVRFQTDLSTGEDYQLWLSIVRKGLPAICLPDVLAVYRVHGNSLSSNKLTAAKNRWRVYREFEGLHWMDSARYLFLYTITGVLKTARMRAAKLS